MALPLPEETPMDRTLRFRRLLADRILTAAGLVAAAAPIVASCGGLAVVAGEGSGGAGGAGGAGPATTTGSTATGTSTVVTSVSSTSGFSVSAVSAVSTGTGGVCGEPQERCFAWMPDVPCPPAGEAIGYFPADCSDGCWVSGILEGPLGGGESCCYLVQTEYCGVGRPLVIDATARTAPARRDERGGWATGAAPSVAGLSAAVRAALAEEWTRAALFEHASVASFSRFSLELLAAGAPAELVEAAHRAALDEVRHAELAFALASAYRGEAVAPGPLPIGGELAVASDLAAIAASAAVEGCVGETIAAVQAAEQLARATDPAVRAALEAIAEDEARHAELAWRTVAWAARAGGDGVRCALADAFARAIEGARTTEITGVELDAREAARLEAHGRIGSSDLRRVAARALDEIVAPAARALLSDAEPPADAASRS